MTKTTPDKRFRILVVLDLADESLRGLRYAMRLGSGNDADVTLLYVRPVDKGLRSGGLQIKLARQNLLEWGLELPGTQRLKKGRDILIEMGFLQRDWLAKTVHRDTKGDPLGDNMIVYTNKIGRSITLKLMVSPSVYRGILDECEISNYDITIISATEQGEDADNPPGFDQSIAQAVATDLKGTIIVERKLEESHGHLICVNGSEVALEAAQKAANIARRFFCPIYLYSVALEESDIEKAEHAIAEARTAIEDMGIEVSGEKIAVGDPVENIVEEGRNYSLIVLSASQKVGLRRFFQTSVTYKVLEQAHNSVMIAR